MTTKTSTIALVLSGGGARAAYQVGVLAAIAEQFPDLQVEILSGVSAGAINTITLAAHPGNFLQKVEALRLEWTGLTADRVYHLRARSVMGAGLRLLGQRVLKRDPPTMRGIMSMAPLRVFLSQRIDLRGIGANIRRRQLRAVTLSATCYRPSETVTFVQGANDLEMWERAQRRAVNTRIAWDHVLASAAIPILFPAVRIDNRYYGDGSVRQAAPLAPAIHLGAKKIIAIGMRPDREVLDASTGVSEYPSAAQVMGMLFHSIFLDALESDAERLERLNAVIRSSGVGEDNEANIRPVDLLLLRPSEDLGALARPHFNYLPPAIRGIVSQMGGEQVGAADFVSYLLFDPVYTVPLMKLGYDDAVADRDRIAAFLEQ